eukprot:3201403-Pyramimonas_sp.AAC.1
MPLSGPHTAPKGPKRAQERPKRAQQGDAPERCYMFLSGPSGAPLEARGAPRSQEFTRGALDGP